MIPFLHPDVTSNYLYQQTDLNFDDSTIKARSEVIACFRKKRISYASYCLGIVLMDIYSGTYQPNLYNREDAKINFLSCIVLASHVLDSSPLERSDLYTFSEELLPSIGGVIIGVSLICDRVCTILKKFGYNICYGHLIYYCDILYYYAGEMKVPLPDRHVMYQKLLSHMTSKDYLVNAGNGLKEAIKILEKECPDPGVIAKLVDRLALP